MCGTVGSYPGDTEPRQLRPHSSAGNQGGMQTPQGGHEPRGMMSTSVTVCCPDAPLAKKLKKKFLKRTFQLRGLLIADSSRVSPSPGIALRRRELPCPRPCPHTLASLYLASGDSSPQCRTSQNVGHSKPVPSCCKIKIILLRGLNVF